MAPAKELLRRQLEEGISREPSHDESQIRTLLARWNGRNKARKNKDSNSDEGHESFERAKTEEGYGKLLLVAMEGSIANFNFTKECVVSWGNIMDELIKLKYNYSLYDKATNKTMFFQSHSNCDCVQLDSGATCSAARKQGRDTVDVLMFHASKRYAFIYQARPLDDDHRYWLFQDESDFHPLLSTKVTSQNCLKRHC